MRGLGQARRQETVGRRAVSLGAGGWSKGPELAAQEQKTMAQLVREACERIAKGHRPSVVRKVSMECGLSGLHPRELAESLTSARNGRCLVLHRAVGHGEYLA